MRYKVATRRKMGGKELRGPAENKREEGNGKAESSKICRRRS